MKGSVLAAAQELEIETSRSRKLKKRLHDAELKNAILKKTIAIFYSLVSCFMF